MLDYASAVFGYKERIFHFVIWFINEAPPPRNREEVAQRKDCMLSVNWPTERPEGTCVYKIAAEGELVLVETNEVSV